MRPALARSKLLVYEVSEYVWRNKKLCVFPLIAWFFLSFFAVFMALSFVLAPLITFVYAPETLFEKSIFYGDDLQSSQSFRSSNEVSPVIRWSVNWMTYYKSYVLRIPADNLLTKSLLVLFPLFLLYALVYWVLCFTELVYTGLLMTHLHHERAIPVNILRSIYLATILTGAHFFFTPRSHLSYHLRVGPVRDKDVWQAFLQPFLMYKTPWIRPAINDAKNLIKETWGDDPLEWYAVSPYFGSWTLIGTMIAVMFTIVSGLVIGLVGVLWCFVVWVIYLMMLYVLSNIFDTTYFTLLYNHLVHKMTYEHIDNDLFSQTFVQAQIKPS